MQNPATDILKRAVEFDVKGQYIEARVCYEEGVQKLIDMVKKESGEKALYIRGMIEKYISRAEKLKVKIEELKNEGRTIEKKEIKNDSVGNSYEKVFGHLLDATVSWVLIEDPYIRLHHQVQNLVRLLELLFKKCPHLKSVQLITQSSNEPNQQTWLNQVEGSLADNNVSFKVVYRDTLHDRKIRLSNGWIIAIGRGLDYFKNVPKLALGSYDMDLRKCSETTVDIYHSDSVKLI